MGPATGSSDATAAEAGMNAKQSAATFNFWNIYASVASLGAQAVGRALSAAWVKTHDELCIKNEELCIKNEQLCIKNEGLCIKNEELCMINDEFS